MLIREQILYDFSMFRPQNFCILLYVPGYVPSVSWFIVCGILNRICILLLCENCINVNYVILVKKRKHHGTSLVVQWLRL